MLQSTTQQAPAAPIAINAIQAIQAAALHAVGASVALDAETLEKRLIHQIDQHCRVEERTANASASRWRAVSYNAATDAAEIVETATGQRLVIDLRAATCSCRTCARNLELRQLVREFFPGERGRDIAAQMWGRHAIIAGLLTRETGTSREEGK